MLADTMSTPIEEDKDDEYALIEQGLRMASDFLSTRAGEPAVTAAKDGAGLENDSGTSLQRDNFTNTALITAHGFEGLEICQNNLILSADQLRQVG